MTLTTKDNLFMIISIDIEKDEMIVEKINSDEQRVITYLGLDFKIGDVIKL